MAFANKFCLFGLALIILIPFANGIPSANGISISASSVNSEGRSDLNAAFRATTEDHVSQHIKLNPSDGSAENAVTGTGTLWGSTLTSSDNNGNKASVYRSVIGVPKETTYSYDWHKGTKGSGVWADISLSAYNAFSINAYAEASNKEGDQSKVYADLVSPSLEASLNKYYASSEAYCDHVTAEQDAGYGSADGSILWGAVEGNAVFGATSKNREGDKADAVVKVTRGKIEHPMETANSAVGSVVSELSISDAYGKTAELSSHVEDKALATENRPGTKIKTFYHKGEGNFGAIKKNGEKLGYSEIVAVATAEDVLIMPETSITKNALILEPYKWEFSGNKYVSIGGMLKDKGYAVTGYSDSAVTRERVYALDEYDVSLIDTHGVIVSNNNKDTLGLSISRGNGGDRIYWSDIDANLNTPNDLIIIDACDVFRQNTDGTSPGKEAVENAQASGGFAVDTASYPDDSKFMDTFFERLCAGDTITDANSAAARSVSNREQLALQGDENYRLK